MGKEFINSPNRRNRLCFLVFGVTTIIIMLHVILPRDLKERQSVIILPPFNIEFLEEHFLELDQKDPRLIQYVRIRHLTPPSKLPYNLAQRHTADATANYKDPFSKWVADFFRNKRGGIFIEAGANEGEYGSHTLYLEKKLGWTGLLIECNPTVVPYLKAHHRKAWVANACLALNSTPGVMNFSNPINWTLSGTFKKPIKLPVNTEWKFFEVQTIPLYTILAAIGWTEIDYFSFDIEGAELSVLKTIPFDIITFKVLILEVYYYYNANEKKELDDFIKRNGYHFVKKIQIDNVYVHESVKHLLPK